MPYGPNVEEAGSRYGSKLLGAIADRLRKANVVGPGNPPVEMAAKGLGWMSDTLAGPENPPVNAMMQVLRRSDPGGANSMANPVAMLGPMLPAALYKYDEFGKRILVNPSTGKAATSGAEFERETARMKAAAEALDAGVRKKEFLTGPFRAAGFRNRTTGEVVEGSLTHPSSLHRIPPSWGGDFDYGYITQDGRFLDRAEATKLTGVGLGGDTLLGASNPDIGLGSMESYDGARKGIYGPRLDNRGAANAPGMGDIRPILEADRKAWNDAVTGLVQKLGVTRDEAVELLGKEMQKRLAAERLSKETLVDAGLKATSLPPGGSDAEVASGLGLKDQFQQVFSNNQAHPPPGGPWRTSDFEPPKKPSPTGLTPDLNAPIEDLLGGLLDEKKIAAALRKRGKK